MLDDGNGETRPHKDFCPLHPGNEHPPSRIEFQKLQERVEGRGEMRQFRFSCPVCGWSAAIELSDTVAAWDVNTIARALHKAAKTLCTYHGITLG